MPLLSRPAQIAHRSTRATCRRVRELFGVLALLAASLLHAEPLELGAEGGARGLAANVRYVELPGTPNETLPQALALAPEEFAPLARHYIDFGSTSNTIWLLLQVHNASGRSGEWLLSFNVRFMTELLAYERNGDRGRVLLDQRDTAVFDERPIRHRLLAAPFSLAADEHADLLIGYRSRGATALPLSIETPASFEERYSREDALNLMSYAAVAFLIVLTLLQSFTFRQPTQLSYAVYLSATLAYILHMDGLTFQYLWPQLPAWNSYAAIPLGLVMSAAALTFARSFVETKRVAPAYDKVLVGLAAAAIAVAVFGRLAAPEAALKGFAYLIASLSAALCLGAAVLAHSRKRPAMRFFVIGWVGVFAGVLATSIVNNFPALMSRTVANEIPKLTIMFDALMFYMALGDRARAWRAQRDEAMQRELEALQVQQQVTQKLHGLERERLEALLLAQAKSQQLAMASHDIRQPLTSLRLTLDRLAGGGGLPSAVATSFKQSLDYLDRLTDEYGNDTERGARATKAAPQSPSTFDARVLLQNIDLMFRDEAEAKGLRFRCRVVAADVRGDAMAAMRIVSNLVVNAVKYTERGKILIGCRRNARRLTFVVADTGPGITPDELARVLKSRERGSAARNTDGQGLGLSIATALAAQNGYDFRCESKPGRGTIFFVGVPLSTVDAVADGAEAEAVS